MKTIFTIALLFSCTALFSQYVGQVEPNEESIIAMKEHYHFSDDISKKYLFIRFRKPGLYEVKSISSNKYGFIDSSGQEIIPCLYDDVSTNDGLIKVISNSLKGLYSYNGEQLLPVEFTDLTRTGNSNNYIVQKSNLWGVMSPLSKINKTVIPIKYNQLYCLNDYVYEHGDCNRFLIRIDSLYGMIDSNEKPIIPPVYTALTASRSGIYQVRKNGKYGYIDSVNNTIVPIIFDEIQPLNVKGLTPAKKEKWGLINRKGKFVIAPQYDDMFTYQGTVIRVRKNGKTGFLDVKGKEFIACIYDDANAYYRDDVLTVNLNGKLGILNRSGKPLTDFVYDKMSKFNYQHAIVKKGNYFGIINNKGVEVLACEYDKIAYPVRNNERFITASKNNIATNYMIDSDNKFISHPAGF